MSRGTLDPTRRIRISPTWLSHSLAGFPTPFGYPSSYLQLSETPKVFLPSVWPLPRSLATTSGISVDFSSSPYLDVSVQAVPPVHLWIQCTVTGHDSSRIAPFGYLWINTCLRLPIAFRSLLRPSSAPSAKAFPLRSF